MSVTYEEMERIFKEDESDYIKEPKYNVDVENLPEDMKAMLLFLMIYQRSGKKLSDIIGAAGHDEIYFSVRPEIVCKYATVDELKYLNSLNVGFDSHEDAFCMFV